MRVAQVTREHVKQWVVKYCGVNKPYNRQWNVYTHLIVDMNEMDDTIEGAYNKMTDSIFKSPERMAFLTSLQKFKDIVWPPSNTATT